MCKGNKTKVWKITTMCLLKCFWWWYKFKGNDALVYPMQYGPLYVWGYYIGNSSLLSWYQMLVSVHKTWSPVPFTDLMKRSKSLVYSMTLYSVLVIRTGFLNEKRVSPCLIFYFFQYDHFCCYSWSLVLKIIFISCFFQ